MDDRQLKIRLPADVKDWLEREAAENCRTQSAEISHILKERMRRLDAEKRNP